MNIRFAFALIAISIFACSKEQPPTAAPVETATASAEPAPPASSPAPTPRKLKKEGEMCGGIAGLRCEEGLECVISPPIHPDKAGSCKKK